MHGIQRYATTRRLMPISNSALACLYIDEPLISVRYNRWEIRRQPCPGHGFLSVRWRPGGVREQGRCGELPTPILGQDLWRVRKRAQRFAVLQTRLTSLD